MNKKDFSSTTSNIYGNNDTWKEIYNKKSLIVSSGAEDFDPESMLDEPVLPSAHQITSQASVAFTKPQVELTLSPPGFESLELFELAGFLHKMSSGDFSFSISIECLLSMALQSIDLCIGKEKAQFIKCIIKPSKSNPLELEYPGFLLVSASLEECAGIKALVILRFERDLEFEKQE